MAELVGVAETAAADKSRWILGFSDTVATFHWTGGAVHGADD